MNKSKRRRGDVRKMMKLKGRTTEERCVRWLMMAMVLGRVGMSDGVDE